MTSTRTAIALLATLAFTGASALAAPPIGVPHVGGPPVNVPPVNVPTVNAPAVNAPPVNPPKPNAGANANAAVSGNASAQINAGPLMHGTLTGMTGSTATVRLSSGKTQTFTVTSQTANELRASIGKPVAFSAQNGQLLLAGHEGAVPLHATVVAVNGTAASLRLANGTLQSYTVTAGQSEWLKAHTGKAIVFWAGANNTLQLNQGTQPASHKREKPQ